MTVLPYLLLADGPSDDALLRVIDWALAQREYVGRGECVAASQQRSRRLESRIREADLASGAYRLLFVHRDAESAHSDDRIAEIRTASLAAGLSIACVPVVPIRMTEAWLLFDEACIRAAAGNPNGREPLHLPTVARLEREPDPKATLLKALRVASSNKPRLRKSFDANGARRALPEYLEDFSPLRALAAFQRFEADLSAALE